MDKTSLKTMFEHAFSQYAEEGIAAWAEPDTACVSHVCFKFQDVAAYKAALAAAAALGAVKCEQFKGKEIGWCRLAQPLKMETPQGTLQLEWLEFVEPREDAWHENGVSSIGYHVEGLKAAEKLPSKDGKITFRYQGLHASQIAA